MSVNNDFYKVINELVSSATNGTLEATDYEKFIDSGRTITDIDGQDLQNNFISALMNRIGKVINTFRSYEGKYKDLIRGTITNGNTIEMIMNHFYDTQAAAFVNLQDNTTVDQYVINKPKTAVRYHTETNAYAIPVTIQRDQLVKAFESPEAMDYFIASITGSVINSNEFAREKGRIALVAKMIAFDYANGSSNESNPDAPAQVYKLISLYNASHIKSQIDGADGVKVLNNEDFVKFAVETIKKVLRKIKSPSAQFNHEGIVTFTPDYGTHLFVNSALVSAMATHIYTNNYNPEYSVLKDYIDVDYWQNANSPLTVIDTPAEGEAITVNNCIAVVCDYYAVGEYLKEQSMDTTPYNARGKYWNNWLNVETRYIHNTFANSVIFVLE